MQRSITTDEVLNEVGIRKRLGNTPPERRLVRFDRAGESVIVADLLAQIGHRFEIDAG
jgi:hypothetical protein